MDSFVFIFYLILLCRSSLQRGASPYWYISWQTTLHDCLHSVAAIGGGHSKASTLVGSEPFSQLAAVPHISHEEDDAQEGDAEREEIEHAGERVVETVERGGDDQRQEPQSMTIARIETGHANEIAGDAAPDGMDERQRRQTRDVKDERRGIVGTDVDRRLILYPFEDTEGDTGHEAVVDHRLWQHRLSAAALEDEERNHLRKLLRQTHAQDIADDAHREGCLGKDIEEIELMQRTENKEYTGLGEEERPDRRRGVHLPRPEHVGEEQPPDSGKVERDSIEDQQAADRQEHDNGERQAHDGEDEQALVLEERVPLDVFFREDEVAPHMGELPEEGAVALDAWADATPQQHCLDGARLSRLGVAGFVVEQQPAVLNEAGHLALVVRAIVVRVSRDDKHKQDYLMSPML